ncbi:protein bric-a-brac 2-like [Diorhabda sublineata]|uniref:protein bric-a-brac 2-like n=1 Tax=Diorhabda sublineata TaxID=1163346 RepID=UPI0024E16336|nr:protein bric-a-brac 2-like [Diorhabda sublineata]
MNSKNVGTGERYNLRWNNFHNNLVQVFSDLKNKEQLVDVTIICEEQHIKAHKLVLAACSDFFMDLFNNTNVAHPVIKFYDIKLSNLIQIIQFIYQGEVKVLDVDLESVLNLGEKFQVKGLSSVKLKHQVGPTGEYVAPKSVKYKILSQYGKSIPDTTINAKTNIPIVEIIDDTNVEPSKKKIKLSVTTKKNTDEIIRKTTETNKKPIDDTTLSTSTTPVRKNISVLKINQPNKATIVIKNYGKIPNKDTSPPIYNNQLCANTTNNNSKTTLKQQPKEDTTREQCDDTKDRSDKPNAFMLFSKEWRKKLGVEYPNEDFKSISVRLCDLWKSLTPETRESYYLAARKAQLSIPQSKSAAT